MIRIAQRILNVERRSCSACNRGITRGWNWRYSYCEKADNETTEMGGVPHVEGGLNSELYAVPVKRRQPKDQKNNATLQNNSQEKPAEVDTADSEDKDENLPPGWQKHEGECIYKTNLRIRSTTRDLTAQKTITKFCLSYKTNIQRNILPIAIFLRFVSQLCIESTQSIE